MDGYFKFFFCVFTFLVLSQLTICSLNNDEHGDIDEKITYNGDQVLRVETVNSKQRKKIKELENKGCK